MRGVSLSPRLLALAERTAPGARFADVGTDHARLPVWLLEHGVIHRAIATDLREGPLERARRTAERHGLTDRISFRLGDGLSPVRAEEADTIAIAGMGGETIAAILRGAAWTARGERSLLLQPMTSAPELRGFLSGSGYTIQEEGLVREGDTIYVTLFVRPGAMEPLTPSERWAGRQSRDMVSPLRGAWLSILIDRARRAGEGLRRSGRASDARRLEELERVLPELVQMKKEWDEWQA